MNIKATRLQAWAPARVGRRPPPLEHKKVFWLYWGPFCYFFFIWGPFCYVFLLFGSFSSCGSLFATFYFMVGASFWACPPPPTKISAGATDCKEVSRACYPKIFLCDRNLVSSGHILFRFCLKNDKK